MVDRAVRPLILSMRLTSLLLLGLCLIFFGCSSSEVEGEDQAKEEISMWETYKQDQINCYKEFIESFERQQYQSRLEATKALNASLDQVEANFSERFDNLEAKWATLLEKYGDNSKKLTAMTDAYYRVLNGYQMDTIAVASLHTQANNKICTIIPETPDADRIKLDLIGRKVNGLPGSHLGESWSWTIERGEIHDFKIVNTKDSGSQTKEYNVTFTLQDKGGAYNVVANIYYTIAGRNDWELDVLLPNELQVVRTGRYDGSISSGIGQYLVGTFLEIRNNSDAALLVGFTTISSQGTAKRHSMVLRGGENKSFNELGLKDYTIDFVERP